MASFYDTTEGQMVELHRILASAGFTNEDVTRIIKEPSLASEMYAAIRPKLSIRRSRWWRTPEEQVKRAHQL